MDRNDTMGGEPACSEPFLAHESDTGANALLVEKGENELKDLLDVDH